MTLKGSRENGCVQAETGEVYDFVSRHFAPWYGIPEDPVTGSAHTVLGPYWAEQLGGKCKLLGMYLLPRDLSDCLSESSGGSHV